MIDYHEIFLRMILLLMESIVRVAGPQAREALLAFVFSTMFLTFYLAITLSWSLFNELLSRRPRP